MEIFFMRINFFFHLDLSKKKNGTLCSAKQTERRYIEAFYSPNFRLKTEKRIQDRSKQPLQDFCCTFIHFSSAPVLGITDLQHNSSRLRQNVHHTACRVSIRQLNKIIVPDVIVTRSLFILWA